MQQEHLREKRIKSGLHLTFVQISQAQNHCHLTDFLPIKNQLHRVKLNLVQKISKSLNRTKC